jgi:hypothetical protein
MIGFVFGTRARKGVPVTNLLHRRERMNVNLTYRSGVEYSESFSNYKVKVSLSGGGKRVHISFREKENGKPYASFTLPYKKARQLAHAMLAESFGDAEPIEFSIDESVGARSAAA